MGKIIIAVDDDIDPENLESVVWALSFRTQPHRDMRIIEQPAATARSVEPQDPPFPAATASALLDRRDPVRDYPPISLPPRSSWRTLRGCGARSASPRSSWASPGTATSSANGPTRTCREAALATLGRYLETGTALGEQPRS